MYGESLRKEAGLLKKEKRKKKARKLGCTRTLVAVDKINKYYY
jgi:hypothetical protein